MSEPTAPPSTPTAPHHHLRVHVSPMGTRCGLAAFRSKADTPAGAWSVRILVLPRAWSEADTTSGWSLSTQTSGEEVLTIIGRECQKLVLPTSVAWLARLAQVAQVVAESDKRSRQTQPEADGATELAVDAELPDSVRGLFSVELVAPSTAATPQLEEPDRSVATAFDHLLRLVLRAQVRLDDRDVRSSSASSGYTVRSGHIRSAAMRALLAQAFVSAVDRNQREVRHGYVVREDDLRSPRGRPTTRGIVRHLATRTPRLTCEHDEFTPGTPLFRVLVSTLDHIVRGGVSQDDLGPTVQHIVDRAADLRQQLAHIPSYLPTQAARIARRLRLTRLTSEWLPALRMARLLLHEDDLQPAATVEGGGGFVWLVESPKLWEQLLEQALQRVGQNVTAQEALEPPWRSGKQLPDLVCRSKSVAWLLDAKYKPHRNNQPSASWADLRQLYVYTLLPPASSARHSPPTRTRTALVYPRVGESPSRAEVRGDWSRRQALWLPRAAEAQGDLRTAINGDDVDLGCILADFPQPSHALASDGAWNRYIGDLGARLVQLLKDQDRHATAPAQQDDPAALLRGST